MSEPNPQANPNAAASAAQPPGAAAETRNVPPPAAEQYPPPAGAPPPAGQYPPPAGAPPPGGQYPPGQYPPPAGQYPPPAAGAPPAAGQYPPAAGAPGQYPPPAGAPPAGQYPPQAGQYPPPPGQYPPPAQYPGYSLPVGYPAYYPPPAGYPGYPQYPGYGAPPPQAYAPPGTPGLPGQPPAAAPYYPPYGLQAPYNPYAPPSPVPGYPAGAPLAAPLASGAAPPSPGVAPPSPYGVPSALPAVPGYPAAVGGVPVVGQGPSGLPLWYLGVQIVDPNTPPAPLGAVKVPGYDPESDYNQLHKLAANGAADDVKVAHILLGLTIPQRDALNDYAVAKTGKTLLGYLDSHVASEANAILRGLVLGPLGYDVELLKKSLAGIGTNEMLLTELILNRPQEELRLLIAAYKQRYGKDLVDAVKSDLSGKIERLFIMALNTQRSPDSVPVDYTQVGTDVEVLVIAVKKKEDLPFIEIFVNRSQPHLAAVIAAYSQRHKSLSKVVKKTFSGDVMRALLYILHGVKAKRDGQGIWRDAKLLEKTMAGLGTRDATLIYRTVRAHWNPHRFESVKTAYKNRYGKTLEARVKGETSGSYREVMIRVLKSTEGK